MRVARRTRMEIRELGGHRLADDPRAGGAQLGHDGGVVTGAAARRERRAELGRIIGGVDDVLDRDRNAVQPPERMALEAAFVEFARLGKRMLAVEMGEGLDLAVACLDALEASAG